MWRSVYGALQLALVGVIVAGMATAGAGVAGYFKGKRAATAERNAHWQGVVDKMLGDHRQAFERARADAERTTTAITKERDDAQDQLAREVARTQALRGDLARAVRDADRLRDQLAAVATGGVAADQDSVAACRDRASALGRVLGEALRASEQCHLDAEDLAAGVRALRSGWPEVTP